MAEFEIVKELDPKLRRLVRSRSDPARLTMDRDAAFVTAEAGAHETTPQLYYKRVLVQIDSPRPPAGIGARWHQIAEGIYTVDVRRRSRRAGSWAWPLARRSSWCSPASKPTSRRSPIRRASPMRWRRARCTSSTGASARGSHMGLAAGHRIGPHDMQALLAM